MDDNTINLAAAKMLWGENFRTEKSDDGTMHIVYRDGVAVDEISGWSPSTDIRDAMKLVEAMRTKGWEWNVYSPSPARQNFVAELVQWPRISVEAEAETAARALAMAAVRAVGCAET